MAPDDRQFLDSPGEAPAPAGGPAGGPTGGPTDGRHRRPNLAGDFADFFSGIFVAPTRTLRDVVGRPAPPFGAVLLAYLLAGLIVDLSGAAAWKEVVRGLLTGLGESGVLAGGVPDVPTGGLVAAGALTGLVARPFLLAVKTGFLAVVASLLGGRGDVSRLFACLALTYLPALAVVPLNLAFGSQGALGSGLATLVGLGVVVWRLVLDILALRAAFGLETSKAVLVALAPTLALLAAAIILSLVWAGAIAWTVVGLYPPAAPPVIT